MAATPLRILLIDDDEDAFLLTRGFLALAPTSAYQLDWVNSYATGLETLRQGRHDACLLDYRLGARNGLDLLRHAVTEGCRTPIIMLTSQGEYEVDLQAMQAGAVDFVEKGDLDGARLERAIRYAVERQSLLATLEKQAEDLKINAAELDRCRVRQVETLNQALHDRLAELDAILDIAPVCVWIAHDPQCHRITGNRLTNELLHVAKGTNLARTALPSPGVAGEGSERLPLAYTAYRDGREIPFDELPLAIAAARGVAVPPAEFAVDLGAGRIVNMVGCAVPLLAADGEVRGAIAAAWDVTAIKQAEAERREFEVQLQHRQKLESLGVLAGGIAHDFNNLLTGILGYADLALLELPPASPIRRYLEQLITGARRAADLTQQMLAYAGRGRFVLDQLDLSEMVKEMSHLLRVSISKKCDLYTELAPGLPAIEADAAQLRQVVMNLILNAVEAIGDHIGIVTIRTRVVNGTRDYLADALGDGNLPEGPYVEVAVSDTGRGMTQDTMSRIFDPFFTTKATGRGLGLAAVMGIIRSHRGAIKIDSRPNHGTTFTVLFPPSQSPQLAAAALAAETPGSPLSGTILIIDDEAAVRGLAKAMVEKMGFTALLAADGREGIEVFRAAAARIAVVLLDLTMPQMNGLETFRELRGLRDDVRVILSSGYNEERVSTQLGTNGLAGFLQKPYKFEDLERALRGALAESRERRAESREPRRQ